MFGSLVVVMPTPHVGGALTLRRGSVESTFDSAADLAGTSKVTYIAFYSDIDHEVALVESGYRVTLTYNLFFEDYPRPNPAMETSSSIGFAPLLSAFRELLESPTALPDGGFLGFGLEHAYPISAECPTALEDLGSDLKGADAALLHVARQLGLHTSLQVVYSDEMDNTEMHMLNLVIPAINGDVYEDVSELFGEFGALKIEPQVPGETQLPVHWITPISNEHTVHSTYIHYGNEASLGIIYGCINLVIAVGGPGKRVTDRVGSFTMQKTGQIVGADVAE